VHILVGTPGRILDLASKGVANLSQCKTVIMDEVYFMNERIGCALFLSPAKSA